MPIIVINICPALSSIVIWLNKSSTLLLTDSLKSSGVDGVLTMRSILENLLRQTSPSHSFLNQGIFHMLKLLKAYDLVKEPQLDMFED